jgi:hypothetical protein
VKVLDAKTVSDNTRLSNDFGSRRFEPPLPLPLLPK